MAADRRVAIVTGGSRGIGKATVHRLAAGGYRVVVNYLHDRRTAEDVVDQILGAGGEAVAVRADVADEWDVARLFAETSYVFGGVDIVVHTVGGRTTAATLLVHRQAARDLRDGGTVVNFADVELPRTLAAELRLRRITVVGVAIEAGGPCDPERAADLVALLVSARRAPPR
ncbi:SDR family NAD(P)-dependent oxidoreductase [Actinoplanes sp. CA-142083]|uniref:SDR family NAD(P)-dependent oxidoreductase n=1 Tax=Actinoplanes sp. CA-142083 TaxID=3239903 RepID=UPI003D9035CD